MPVLELELVAHRYHATPWGHHVNEGLVEWPPSPYRLCRALIGTGFTKLGWDPGQVPREAVRLLEQLASALPSFVLPIAGDAHTRHYMPTGSREKSGELKTTKVFDTFKHFGASGPEDDFPKLWVHWPAELDTETERLLGSLVENLGYLGRAESWVAGCLRGELPVGAQLNAHPMDAGSPPGDLSVESWAPELPAAYSAWRAAALEGAFVEGASRGKLTEKKKLEIARQFPPDLFHALRLDTRTLQREGWSRPPGVRRVTYVLRHSDRGVERSGPPIAAALKPVESVLFAITSNTKGGNVRPRLTRAFEVGQLLHKAAVKAADGRAPVELVGKSEEMPLSGHRHAHYFSLDLDRDGRIDHVLGYCADRFSLEGLRALRRVRRIWDSDSQLELFSVAVAEGDLHLVSPVLEGAWDASLVWATATPFVCPRFLKAKGKNSLEGQVRAELQSRGLPEPVRFVPWSEEEVRARRFHEFHRVKRNRPPPNSRVFGFTLEFERPIRGPIAIGYGSHYGLGLLEARR